MKTKVFGKVIENNYSVIYNSKQIDDENGNVKTVYTDKPMILKGQTVKEWIELCSYKGEPRYNSNDCYILYGYRHFNIAENETVRVEEEIFRADLNEMHLHTDKIVEEKDIDKEEALFIFDGQVKAFNKMMIESNDRLKAYCDLHKLSYEDTDCIELFKLVFPDDEYVIQDGIMRVKEKPQVTNIYDCALTNAITESYSNLNTLLNK